MDSLENNLFKYFITFKKIKPDLAPQQPSGACKNQMHGKKSDAMKADASETMYKLVMPEWLMNFLESHPNFQQNYGPEGRKKVRAFVEHLDYYIKMDLALSPSLKRQALFDSIKKIEELSLSECIRHDAAYLYFEGGKKDGRIKCKTLIETHENENLRVEMWAPKEGANFDREITGRDWDLLWVCDQPDFLVGNEDRTFYNDSGEPVPVLSLVHWKGENWNSEQEKHCFIDKDLVIKFTGGVGDECHSFMPMSDAADIDLNLNFSSGAETGPAGSGFFMTEDKGPGSEGKLDPDSFKSLHKSPDRKPKLLEESKLPIFRKNDPNAPYPTDNDFMDPC